MLRRDVYHCTPSVFNQETWEDVAMDLHLLNIEAKVNEHKNKKKGARAMAHGASSQAPGQAANP